LRSFFINQKTHGISITPQKALIGRKKDYLTVIKNGYLTWDVIPFIDESKFDFEKKESFLFYPMQV